MWTNKDTSDKWQLTKWYTVRSSSTGSSVDILFSGHCPVKKIIRVIRNLRAVFFPVILRQGRVRIHRDCEKIENRVHMYIYTVRKFNWWRYCLARVDEIFDYFLLCDETLRPIELCNNVISQICNEIRQNFSNSVYCTSRSGVISFRVTKIAKIVQFLKNEKL